MGQEISNEHFSAEDFAAFSARLREETDLLRTWSRDGHLSQRAPVGGFELEAWLVDPNLDPAPCNVEFLAALSDPLFCSELARFNVEINNPPHPLHGDFLTRMETGLRDSWARGVRAAAELGLRLVMIGILPTVRQSELGRASMSPMKRYAALNQQVLAQRRGEALDIDIQGHDHLEITHDDIMLESATTSLQLHLQVPAAESVAYYNASLLASAPVLAAGVNSPFLFGHDLWDETRVPLFEQAVEAGGYAGATHGPLRRVSFGSGYARRSLCEVFAQNLEHFPVLLPVLCEEPLSALAHLRLHNGTLWPWNRPLVGRDPDTTPHLRIEHRSLPGGPSVVDIVANAAFYFGLTHYLSHAPDADLREIGFSEAKDNFYAAARYGLRASLLWREGRHVTAKRLILGELVHLARQGLHDLDIRQEDIERFVDIVEARVASGQTGAAWQRRYAARHGHDMHALTGAYLDNLESGKPVHEWPV